MANAKLCSIANCDKSAVQKGYCRSHYMRIRRYGSPDDRQNKPEVIPWVEANVGHSGHDCLWWPFARNHSGYGVITLPREKSSTIASRFMCIMAHGEPPTDQYYQAAHSCGNGHLGCVNPKHLRWATINENAAEVAVHGRRVCGERVNSAKLTREKVLEVRGLRARGMSVADIALKFGLSTRSILSVVTRKSWRHVL